ncbi:type II CRISPR RNA-guided endonuclease Cas9 [Parafilimonas sp.]|uniref:type II CRISPR RNA-guided endonuclease Cas9 n=1 Tax=Parafilimonas sp. TaxID=1969739 RepID=UPI0039E28812
MANKKILGLDIGTTSIGWAIVEATDEKKTNERTGKKAVTDINNDRIGIYQDAVGVRIIQEDKDGMQRRFNEGKKLNEGETLTPTAKRRIKRGSRKLKSRYKLRRDKLCSVLELVGMLPDDSYKKETNKNGKKVWKPVEEKNNKWYTNKKVVIKDANGVRMKKKREEGDLGEQLYKLRTDAINQGITLQDWGRILLHLNQWRGYSSDRFIKDEKSKKSYYTVQITEFDTNKFISHYDKKDKEKKEPLYNEYEIKLTCEEGIEIKENEETKVVYELTGKVFYKNPDLKEGDFIPIKNVDGGKKEKKITTEFGDFTITNPDADDWDYNRHKLNKSLEKWCKQGGTVGSYFFSGKYLDKTLERIRANVVNREWYEAEFEKVFDRQFEKHREHFDNINTENVVKSAFKDYQPILNEVKKKNGIKEQLKCLIRDKIIYYQRPWQQSKNKAGCRFEKVRVFKKYFDKPTQTYKPKDTPEYEGRKVIPKSHPLHQDFKIWTYINNVRLFYNEPNKVLDNGKLKDIRIDLFSANDTDIKKAIGKSLIEITGKTFPEIKNLLYDELQNSKSISWKKFVEDKLGLNVADELVDTEKNGKEKRKKKKQGVDTETGEKLTKFYSVNYSKLKRDKSGFEDIRLKGNTTKYLLKEALKDWFKENNFYKDKEIEGKKEREIIFDNTDEWFNTITKTGTDKHKDKKENLSHPELKAAEYKIENYEVTNLQLLWEIIYDITNKDEASVKFAIKKNFQRDGKCIFSDNILKLLSKIKFEDSGMANLSAKAIRNILPLMSNGKNTTNRATQKINSLIALNNSEEEKAKDNDEKLECLKDFVSEKNARLKLSTFTSTDNFKYLNYWEAAAVVYGSHSTSSVKRVEKLERIPKGKMNNPVVEKIVNETLMLVNEIISHYGKMDEIRIELSRELKASADERKQMDEAMTNNNNRNELAKKMLREIFGNPSPSQNDLTKLKVYEDVAKVVNNERYEELKKKEGYSLTDEDKLLFYENAYKEFGLKEPRTADVKRYRLWMDQKCQCPYTGEMIRLSDLLETDKYEVEHIIPRQRYYDNSYSNKVITRKVINEWKDRRTAYEFITQESEKSKTDTSDNKTLTILKWDGKSETDAYPVHIKRLFPKGRKQKNLLRKDIPDDPVERQLKETQYINKKLKEELIKVLPEGKEVQVTTGSITDILRGSWHLEDVMKKLVENRYKKFKIGMGSGKAPIDEEITYKKTVKNKKTNDDEEIEVYPAFSKRLDHRHHALDAIIIACTKQWHIQYVNTLNASWSVDDITDEKQKADKYEWNKDDILRKREKGEKGAYDFIYPWKDYNKSQIFELLERVVISHKNTIPLISPSKNILHKNGQTIIIGKPEDSISIRASLHKETLIGYRKFYNNDSQVKIEDIIERIFERRKKAKEELKPILSFRELINLIIFKERFRNKLIGIFDKYDTIEPEIKKNDSKIKEDVLNEIKANKPFEWAYTFDVVATKTGTDKSGTIDKLSPEKINDERISRYLQYRIDFIKSTEEELEKLKQEKADDDKIKIQEELIKKAKDYPDGFPIYYNAVYDVRIPTEKNKWVLVTQLNQELFDKIEYNKNKKVDNKRNKEVKDKLLEYKGNLSWQEAFNPERVFIKEPPVIGNTKIKIKKASQKNKTTIDTLYPIRPQTKTYAELDGNYRVYVFEDNNGKREWKMLSNMDAMLLKKENRKVRTELLYPIELIGDLTKKGFKQIFSFGKNDTIFINPASLIDPLQRLFTTEYIENDLFNWEVSEDNSAEKIKEKQKAISKSLWQVAIISKSTTDPEGSLHFVQMHTATEIKIPINEVNTAKMQDDVRDKIEKMKNIFNTTKKAEEKNKNRFIEESIIVKNKEMFENCYKVYVNKLGKKVAPYWEFENGCWNKEDANRLGFISKEK